MGKKSAIDRGVEALEAKRADVLEKAKNEAAAIQASIDVLKAQRRTPKPRVVKPAALAG